MNNLFYIFLSIFFFVTTPDFTQTPEKVTHTASDELLKTPITLRWEKTTLREVLHQLSYEYDLNFMFSDNLMGKIVISSGEFHEQPLDKVLDKLLPKETTTYVAVGSAIVIYEQEQGSQEEKNDTRDAPKEMAKPSAPQTPRIYGSNVTALDLPPRLRREIHRLYKRELRLYAQEVSLNDTISTTKKTFKEHYFHLSGTIGVAFGIVNENKQRTTSINKTVSYRAETSNSIYSQICMGYVINRFVFKGGMGFQSHQYQEKWSIINQKGNSRKSPEITSYTYDYRLTFLSFPLKVAYSYKKDRWFGALGVGAMYSFILSRIPEKTALNKKYIEEIADKGLQEKKQASFSLLAEATFGYQLDRLTLALTIAYQKGLTPFLKNDAYDLRWNNKVVGLSVILNLPSSQIKQAL